MLSSHLYRGLLLGSVRCVICFLSLCQKALLGSRTVRGLMHETEQEPWVIVLVQISNAVVRKMFYSQSTLAAHTEQVLVSREHSRREE